MLFDALLGQVTFVSIFILQKIMNVKDYHVAHYVRPKMLFDVERVGTLIRTNMKIANNMLPCSNGV